MAIHISSKTRPLKLPKPTDKEELQELIRQELERQGPDADLNFIDVSEIEDMTFCFINFTLETELYRHIIDHRHVLLILGP